MFDLVLSGGLIVDGTRAKAYPATICIENGRIARITSEPVTNAKEIVDVAGRVVAPGFIDIHTHSDASPLVDYIVESDVFEVFFHTPFSCVRFMVWAGKNSGSADPFHP